MSINAQPSTIDAQGNGLAQWLGTVSVAFEQGADNVIKITKDAYQSLMATDPWLEQFAEKGVLALVDALGNADSTSSNSGSDSSQSQTAAGSDAGAGDAGDAGNGGTAPDANGNSGIATGSDAPSDASGTSEQSGSSSQDSGSSSDAPPSSNSPSVTGGDAPTPAPSPAPVVTPVEPAVNTQPVTETSSAVAWLEQFAQTASIDARAIINTILSYVRDMAPGKTQTPESMQRQQVNLNSALSGAINRLDGEFKAVWGGILRLAHEHRDGVFHDRYVYRQLQNAPLNPTQRAFFERTINMIKLTADPQSRKAGLKQFDKDRTMQHGMTEAGRNRLLSFYDL